MGQTGWCSIYACTGHVRAQADVELGTDTAGVVRNGAQRWRMEGGSVANSCPLKVNRNKLCWLFRVRLSGSLPREEAWASS